MMKVYHAFKRFLIFHVLNVFNIKTSLQFFYIYNSWPSVQFQDYGLRVFF